VPFIFGSNSPCAPFTLYRRERRSLNLPGNWRRFPFSFSHSPPPCFNLDLGGQDVGPPLESSAHSPLLWSAALRAAATTPPASIQARGRFQLRNTQIPARHLACRLFPHPPPQQKVVPLPLPLNTHRRRPLTTSAKRNPPIFTSLRFKRLCVDGRFPLPHIGSQ